MDVCRRRYSIAEPRSVRTVARIHFLDLVRPKDFSGLVDTPLLSCDLVFASARVYHFTTAVRPSVWKEVAS